MTSLFFLPRVVVCRQCVCCVCVGGLFSLSLVQFLSQHFFLGGLGTQPLLHFCVCPSVVFFFLFLISRLPRLSICFISVNFNSPLFCFSLVPYIFFFVPIMWSSSINIYIYTYIIVCVCVLYSILGAKEEKKQQLFWPHSFLLSRWYILLYSIRNLFLFLS